VSLVDWLLQSRTPLELAKELAAKARENAALKDEVGRLKHENFWIQVSQRKLDELQK
jgi:hypothetical protein